MTTIMLSLPQQLCQKATPFTLQESALRTHPTLYSFAEQKMLAFALSSAVATLAANMAKVAMDQTHCCKMACLEQKLPNAVKGIHAVL